MATPPLKGIKKAQGEGQTGKGRVARGRVLAWSRLPWLAAAVAVFAVATVTAILQPPHPDAYRTVRTGSLDWWLYPIERNAFRRLPYVGAPINDVFQLEGTEKLWAVGEDGTIIQSDDAGRSWTNQEVDWSIPPKPSSPLPKRLREPPPESPTGEDAADADKPTPMRSNAFLPWRESAWPLAVASVLAMSGPPSGQKQTPEQSDPKMETTPGAAKGAGTKAPPDEPRIQTSKNLGTVYFIDDQSGWAGTGDGSIVVSTNDGGQSWRTTGFLPVRDGDGIKQLLFFDARRGLALLRSGELFETPDGGATWTVTGLTGGAPVLAMGRVEGLGAWVAVGSFIGGLEAVFWTTDGGVTWSRVEEKDDQLHGLPPAIGFLDERTGWSLGGRQTWWTSDRGRTWEARPINELADGDREHWCQFVDRDHGWVLSRGGHFLATDDGGHTWQILSRGRLTRFRFFSRQRGFGTDQVGSLLATSDGGETWRQAARPSLPAARFVDRSTGWAVGVGGTVLATRDGGKTWSPQDIGANADLIDVAFADALHGWVLSFSGHVFATSDGGQTWASPIALESNMPAGDDVFYVVESIAFTDRQQGWVSGRRIDGGNIGPLLVWSSNDGGSTWTRIAGAQAPQYQFHGSMHLAVQSPNVIWVSSGHEVYISTDGARSWEPRTIPQIALGDGIVSISFADARTGWIITESRKVFETLDAGSTWSRKALVPSSAAPNELRYLSPTTAYFLDPNSIVQFTYDGVQRWSDPTKAYASWPGPWYYLTWILVLAILFLAFRQPEETSAAAPETAIADTAASDRPLEPGDPDALDFGVLAKGLGFFLRNRNTEAPLTIAIQGEWGTGKSSLMNLLQDELKRAGCSTVFFNAWHHQTEEHLLASLLEHIRQRADIPWWDLRRFRGLAFRIRLWGDRFRRHFAERPGRTLGLIFLFVFSTAIIALNLPTIASDLQKTFQASVTSQQGQVRGAALSPAEKPDTPAQPESSSEVVERTSDNTNAVSKTGASDADGENAKDSLAVKLLTALSGIVVVWSGVLPALRNIRVIGVNPMNLIGSVGKSLRRAHLEARTSFRYRFAAEFREVTRALGRDSKLVIFIDDLDRCGPDNVVDMLQAVNYLVTAGRCVIVLAFDPVYVRTCIRLRYTELIDELEKVNPSGDASDSSSPASNGSPQEFAKHYLQKLVNVQMPLPKPTRTQSARLLARRQRVAARAEPWSKRAWQAVLAGGWRYAVAITVVAITAWAALWLAEQVPYPESTEDARQSAPEASATATTSEGGPIEEQTKGKLASMPIFPKTMAAPRGPFVAADPSARSPGAGVWLFVVILLLGGGAVAFSLAPLPPPITDSSQFVSGRMAWHPLLYRAGRTPREIKRFTNRIRYFAMRQRAEGEAREKQLGEASPDAAAETATDSPAAAREASIPDDVLVALSAIQEVHPHWLDDPGFAADFVQFINKHATEVPKKVVDYVSSWGAAREVKWFLPRFKEISQGIQPVA